MTFVTVVFAVTAVLLSWFFAYCRYDAKRETLPFIGGMIHFVIAGGMAALFHVIHTSDVNPQNLRHASGKICVRQNLRPNI